MNFDYTEEFGASNLRISKVMEEEPVDPLLGKGRVKYYSRVKSVSENILRIIFQVEIET